MNLSFKNCWHGDVTASEYHTLLCLLWQTPTPHRKYHHFVRHTYRARVYPKWEHDLLFAVIWHLCVWMKSIKRTLQSSLWCRQVVYSAGMVNNLVFYRRQSSTINNSAVIKQFLGQWASGNHIFSWNVSQSWGVPPTATFLGFNHDFRQVTHGCFWMIHSG